MTKAQLIAKTSKKIEGQDKEAVTNIISNFLETLKEEMAEGNNIYLRGFGSFINKKRAGKIGRNITKQKQIIIPERYVPVFKPSKLFLNLIKESEKVKKMNEAHENA